MTPTIITIIGLVAFVAAGVRYQNRLSAKCLTVCDVAEKYIEAASGEDENQMYTAYKMVNHAKDLAYDRYTNDRAADVSHAFTKKFSALAVSLNHESVALVTA